MGIPNILTLLRIFFVLPFILILSIYISINQSATIGGRLFSVDSTKEWWMIYLALGIFISAMITDFIDGYVARKTNQITLFGKVFDPLADKFMTTTALIFLSILGYTHYVIVILFLLRDLLVDGTRNIAASKGLTIAASNLAKTKTLIQSIAIVVLFVVQPIIISRLFLDFDGNYVFVLMFLLVNSPLIIACVLSLVSGYQYVKPLIKYLKEDMYGQKRK